MTCQIPSVYVAWKWSKSLCGWVCKPILVLALVQTRILDLDLDHAEQFPFPLGLYDILKGILFSVSAISSFCPLPLNLFVWTFIDF